LNPASRGLLLDPTNGLSDIERGEVRALTIHSFTNQPVRLLRVLRYAARMGFKPEQRTQEWFDLAIERDLHHNIEPEAAGAELRALAREERPAVILKAWEEHDLVEAVHPLLAKKHPDYDAINRLMKVREDLFTAGVRPRLATPMMLAILGKLKDREQESVLSKAGFRSAEIEAIVNFDSEVSAGLKELAGRKMAVALDAYKFIEKLPVERIAYALAESNNSAAISKIRAYLNKWRPIRATLSTVGNELEALGFPRGPKFDAIVEQVFGMQLNGRGKTPEEREKILRKLSGIKEQPKKKEKEKKPAKASEKHAAPAEKMAPKPGHAEAAKKAISAKHATKHHAPSAPAKSMGGAKKSSGRK
jgi:tRNA nucleotidyltransferase (CCA-adding enzyme)